MTVTQESGQAKVETLITAGPVAAVELSWPDRCGAESVFVGRTRMEVDPVHGPLTLLQYEVYEPMARKLLQHIAGELLERYDCQYVRIAHARGDIEPGKASVVIQVATPHRAEAFAACRHAIERIKCELPVWKRQVWRDGHSFAEGCAVQIDHED